MNETGTAQSPSPTALKDINILVLGETGVGKSTWINSFANYLEYSNLDEAESNEIVPVIPINFTITDDNYEQRVIKIGDDRNEVIRPGESTTQRPRTYNFPYYKGQPNIRIIDTPGIGDSRGPAQDRLNFQMILDHLACYKEVHGICILMKPNNARITVLFEFCIKYLLTHLHRDAIRNIVFCFTNARNTYYRPGETLPALRQLLSTYQNLEIPLNKTTLYCFDNEAIQFLAASKKGVNLDDQWKVYTDRWEISAKETHRLLQHLILLEPHALQNTLSVNDARRLIIGLTKPLVDVGNNIQENIQVAKRKKVEIENTKASQIEVSKHLFIPVVNFKYIQLEKPLQVCTARKCLQEVTLDNGQVSYKHHCSKLVSSSGMFKKMFRPKNCSRCDCPKTLHNTITYKIVEEFKQEKVAGLEDRLNKIDVSIESVIQEFLGELLDRIQCLENEQKEIINVLSQFACFLNENAIAPYNDAMVRYLDQKIETVKLDRSVPGGGGFNSRGSLKKVGNIDGNELQQLEKLKHDYEKEVEILKHNIANASAKKIMCDDIPILKQTLINLPINGHYIQTVFTGQENRVTTGADERQVPVKRKGTMVTGRDKPSKYAAAGKEKKRNVSKGILASPEKSYYKKDAGSFVVELNQQTLFQRQQQITGTSAAMPKQKSPPPPPKKYLQKQPSPPKTFQQLQTPPKENVTEDVQTTTAPSPKPVVSNTVPAPPAPPKPMINSKVRAPPVPPKPVVSSKVPAPPASPAPSSKMKSVVTPARSAFLSDIQKGVKLKKVEPSIKNENVSLESSLRSALGSILLANAGASFDKEADRKNDNDDWP